MVKVTVNACRVSSRTLTANKEIITQNKVSLYPNPASNTVMVNIETSGTAKDVSIRLMNMYGKVLLQQTAVNNYGLVQKMVDVSKFQAGVYVIKMLSATKAAR